MFKVGQKLDAKWVKKVKFLDNEIELKIPVEVINVDNAGIHVRPDSYDVVIFDHEGKRMSMGEEICLVERKPQ